MILSLSIASIWNSACVRSIHMVLIYCKTFLFSFKQILDTSGWVCLFRNNVASPSLSSRCFCLVVMKYQWPRHTASQYEH